MSAKRGQKIDIRNFLIVVLSLVVCVETFLLYKSDPERFKGLFVHTKTETRPAKAVKKAKAEKPRPSVKAEQAVEEDVPAPVLPAITKPSGATAKVAIIIDDWGYSTKNCQYLRDFKNPITVAILPNLQHSIDVMNCAHEAGQEIMLHLPMEPHKNTDSYPTDYILTTKMLPTKVDKILSDILDKMPYVQGVNNHMGSKATEDRRLMTTVYRQLRHRKLFYVDSRVTAKSVCAPLAKEIGVSFTSRDVFLDNVNERVAIQNQLAVLARLAKKRGWAIAIGHDRSLTLQVIQERAAWFKEQGIEFVTVKEILGQ
jgi:uncharacterized protein